jgi:hypothetical protein
MLNCPSCKRIIVDTTKDGGVKVRSRMILFNGSEAHAICPSCKTKVVVPLSVDTSKLPHDTKPKHFVQN